MSPIFEIPSNNFIFKSDFKKIRFFIQIKKQILLYTQQTSEKLFHFGRTSNSVIFRIVTEVSGSGDGSVSSSNRYVDAMANIPPSGLNDNEAIEVGNLRK